MQEQSAAIKAAEAEIAVIEAGVQNRVTEAEQNESLFPKVKQLTTFSRYSLRVGGIFISIGPSFFLL